MFDDYKVIKNAEMDVTSLISEDGNLVVKGPDHLAFSRVALKIVDGDHNETVRLLVGELNGVRLYYDGHTVIMTTEDLYP
jgi:hypothetical protein